MMPAALPPGDDHRRLQTLPVSPGEQSLSKLRATEIQVMLAE